MRIFRSRLRSLLTFASVLFTASAQAGIGYTEIPGVAGEEAVTLYYPSSSPDTEMQVGVFSVALAMKGAPVSGNGRLIVISHGSGGGPLTHATLARALVEDGFIVALPSHRGDNFKNPRSPGPDSWKLRPIEVSHAIDAVGQDPVFGPMLSLDKVGMYGMSAGGHTALSLAGGRWSPALYKKHCEANLAEDFNACVGLTTSLNGGFFDGVKKTVASWVIGMKYNDSTWYTHTDPRIAAIIAGVPFAADFDMASLVRTRMPVGIVTAQQDAWLHPRFHSDRVLKVCGTCELLADIRNGGHSALLSPMPAHLSGVAAEMLNDPPGFDRKELPEIDQKMVAFFRNHLLP